MAGLGNNVKKAFLKGLEALGKGASNMADSAHHKLSEINLETRRHELLGEFPVRALDLWQKGAELPDELAAMLQELSDLDEQLTLLRAQRYAKVEATQEASEAMSDELSTDEAAEATDASAESAENAVAEATNDANPIDVSDAAEAFPTENE